MELNLLKRKRYWLLILFFDNNQNTIKNISMGCYSFQF